MADNKVSVELSIEQAQALEALSNLTKGVDKFAKTTEASTKKAEASVNSFGKTVLAVFAGNLIAHFAEKAIESLSELPKIFIELAHTGAEVDTVNKKLANALAISGAAGEDAAKGYDELSNSIGKLVGIGPLAVKNAAAYALTLGATDEQAQKIVKTAADVSVALGTDFQGAVQQLTASLEGSAGRLSKVSNEVRRLDEDALKSGKAIDILANKFGGLALANAGNIEVQFKNITENISNLREATGEAIVTNDKFRGAFLVINDALVSFEHLIINNRDKISEFTGQVVDGFFLSAQATAAFTDAIVRLGGIVKNLIEVTLGGLATSLNGVEYAVTSVIDKINGALGIDSNLSKDSFDRLQTSVKSVNDDVSDLNKALGPDAYTPGVQAVFDLADAYEKSGARITASDAAAEEARKKLTESGIQERRAKQAQRLQEEQAFQDQLTAIESTALITKLEGEAQLRDQNALFRIDETEAIQQFELTKLNLQFDAQQKKLMLLNDGTKREQELALNAANRKKAIAEFETKNELEQQKIRQQNLKDSFGSIATLTTQSNKELFAIGKAAALATATIDGIAAVQKALASAPPPFNFVIAALVGTVQALNLSKIASQQPPSFAQGGIVPGTSFSGDKVAANVNSGEMILNRQQQSNLFDIANGGGSNGGVVQAIAELGDRIAAIQTQIVINGREIARVVRDEREAGFAV